MHGKFVLWLRRGGREWVKSHFFRNLYVFTPSPSHIRKFYLSGLKNEHSTVNFSKISRSKIVWKLKNQKIQFIPYPEVKKIVRKMKTLKIQFFQSSGVEKIVRKLKNRKNQFFPFPGVRKIVRKIESLKNWFFSYRGV